MSGEVLDFSGREICMRVQIYGLEAERVQYVTLSDFLGALAQRDAARDIAARLEGECARLTERASRESIRDVLRANLFDGSDEGLTTMPAKVFLDDASEVIADWLADDPDAVIAEGES